MTIKIFDENKNPLVICPYCKEGRHAINELCPRCGFDGQEHTNPDAKLRIIKFSSDIHGAVYGKIEVGAIHVYSYKGSNQEVNLEKIKEVELVGYNLDANYALRFHPISGKREDIIIWKFANIEEAEERLEKFIHICTNLDFEKFYMEKEIEKHLAAFQQIRKFIKQTHPQMRQLTIDNIQRVIDPYVDE